MSTFTQRPRRRRLLPWLVNGLAVLVAAVGVIIVTSYQADRDAQADAVDSARFALRQVEQALQLHATVHDSALNAHGFPHLIDPAWFDPNDIPRNTLLSTDHPWIEIAGDDQAHLLHPPVRLANSPSVAGFWYNPVLGIVRARVPVQINDKAATDMYNQLNGTRLASIFHVEAAQSFRVIALPAANSPAAQPPAQRQTAGANDAPLPPNSLP